MQCQHDQTAGHTAGLARMPVLLLLQHASLHFNHCCCLSQDCRTALESRRGGSCSQVLPQLARGGGGGGGELTSSLSSLDSPAGS